MSQFKSLARYSLLSVLTCMGIATAWAGDEAADSARGHRQEDARRHG